MPAGSMSPLVVVPTARSVATAGNDADQDDVIVAILSQDAWDDQMTKMTVDNLCERTKRRTSGGHLYNVKYLNRLLYRLDNAGISAERRFQVFSLTQTVFRQMLSDWSICIDQIRNPDFLRELSCINLAERRSSTPPGTIMTPSRLRLLDLDKSAEPVGARAARESSSSSSNDQDSASVTHEHQVNNTYAGTRRNDSSVNATESFSAASSMSHVLVPRGERSINNKRMYGTVCPKAPFDVFARSVIAAWASALSPEDAPTKIRQYAKPAWQGYVTLDQKDEWYKIYEARKDPFIDVTAMGVALLAFQSLLAKVVPRDRLAAAKILCQQHQKKSGATLSSKTAFATTTTPLFSPGTGAVGSAPVTTDPAHQKEIPGTS